MYSSLTIFVAELIGTFGLVVAATGSIVYDGSVDFSFGPVFVAGIHFIGLSVLVFVFGKYSMAHFNPAVTVGFTIAGYLDPKKIPLYLVAQLIGAISGSLFVKFVLGDYAKLGLNFPNYEYSLITIFGVEVLASLFLMGGILAIISIKRIHLAFVSIVVGSIVALDVYFLGPISGASMNPIRSLAPSIVTGITDDLWLYWSAPFIGAVIAATIYWKIKKKTNEPTLDSN